MNHRDNQNTIRLNLLQRAIYNLLGSQRATQITIEHLLPLNALHPDVGPARDEAYISKMQVIILKHSDNDYLCRTLREVEAKINEYNSLVETKRKSEQGIEELLSSVRS